MSDPAPAGTAAPGATTDWHTLSIADALSGQGVTAEQGLSAAEVETRRATFGANKFAEQKTAYHLGQLEGIHSQYANRPLETAADLRTVTDAIKRYADKIRLLES